MKTTNYPEPVCRFYDLKIADVLCGSIGSSTTEEYKEEFNEYQWK